MNTDSQWGKQEACFAYATQVLLAVNSVTSRECIRCSKIIARANKLASCQSNVYLSYGYERVQKSLDSLQACNEFVCSF